ncbi:NACHT domain-containing protein [Pseudanabaena sp. PCC 6802]|uniref:NACHT domain-containing protein n=1 Tax=Pseudanabaena sp. PCC 6802 TaxID=118173 RepID=UPI00034970A1|nr:NACHT domain-containing protein [Pseudanabaena sp. PCC 6802]
MTNQLIKTSNFPQPNDREGEANASLQLEHHSAQIADYVERACDRLRVMGLTKPLKLSDVYVPLHVIRNDSNFRYATTEISANDDLRAKLADANEKSVPALAVLEKLSRVIILGNMGSGKTTLLKQLALQCTVGKFQSHRIPISISLHEFSAVMSQVSLLDYIASQALQSGTIESSMVMRLLVQGKLLLSIDELDELTPSDANLAMRQIRNLADYFPGNYWAIACRPTVSTQILEQFTEVELAGFNRQQIETFVHKWLPQLSSSTPIKSKVLLAQLFGNPSIGEIATNPLLLTLLCKKFAVSSYLSFGHAIQDAIDLWLYEWDCCNYKFYSDRSQEPTKRDLKRQKDILSWIALSSFNHGTSLFDLPRIEQYVAQYTKNFPGQSTWDDIPSTSMVERTKGIYSFAYVSFQEYLVAYHLIHSPNPSAIKYLVERITDKRWHNVIIMAVSILPNANDVVRQMKQRIDKSIGHERLQQFLEWVNQQVSQLQSPYSPETLRAFYLDIDLERTRALDRARALEIAHMRSLERARVRAEGKANDMDTEIDIDYALTNAINLDLTLYCAQFPILELACALEPILSEQLENLKRSLPSPTKEAAKFKKWWAVQGLEWAQKLRKIIIQHRRGIQDWELSEAQIQALKRYYDANKTLVECLHSSTVSEAVRQEIKSTLLLSIARIEQSKPSEPATKHQQKQPKK